VTKRWTREPLLHFILLGSLLFALDAFLREREVEAGAGDIVVSEGRIENLAALFAKTWQRPPSAAELGSLVDDYVLEEALYREGLELGVDRDDAVIRRRVRQKMEFVVGDVVELAEPSEEQLEAWLAEHPESYERPERFTFRQVFLSRDKRGAALRSDADHVLAVLASLSAEVDPTGLGDPTLLEHAFGDSAADSVAASFGPSFLSDLARAPTGAWSGPIESPFGLHLVFVDARDGGRLPSLDEVRDAVARDWSYARRAEASEQLYETILARYQVTIEWPQHSGSQTPDTPTGVRE